MCELLLLLVIIAIEVYVGARILYRLVMDIIEGK